MFTIDFSKYLYYNISVNLTSVRAANYIMSAKRNKNGARIIFVKGYVMSNSAIKCRDGSVLFDFEKKLIKFTRRTVLESRPNIEIPFDDVSAFLVKEATFWDAAQFALVVNGKRLFTPKDVIEKSYEVTAVVLGGSSYKQIIEEINKFCREVRDVSIEEIGTSEAPQATYTPDGIIEEKEEININIEYRKKCNVCGKIYCFNSADIQRNQDLAKQAKRHANVGVLTALAGTRYDTYEQSKQADAALNKIVDYSRCPSCNSTDISDLTEEEFKSAMATNNAPASTTVVQQTTAADELKKFKDLLDAGIITQEEFEAKKKQLLGL